MLSNAITALDDCKCDLIILNEDHGWYLLGSYYILNSASNVHLEP
jgi:hypothetical protein